MSQHGVFPMNQRDLLRQLSAIVHTINRDDIKVRIQFLVNFGVDEETYVNTILDPWQPLTRTQLRGLVDTVVTKLTEVELANDAERKAQAVLLPGVTTSEAVPEPTNHHVLTAETGVYTASQVEDIVPEYNQAPGG